ncbi:hypothetical protein O8B94_02000, partial [Agrobacterium rhizogenes]|uniref:hypothetical protein n=1 Tax=Rhizobium rhizogenes TaxID=359 RepID=UPI0022BB2083
NESRRRQQRRRPRSVSGLINPSPQTSQQHKSQKIGKSLNSLVFNDSLRTFAKTGGFPCFSRLTANAAAPFR